MTLARRWGRGGDRRCPRLRHARARLTGALPHDHLCDLLRDRAAAELGVRSPAAPVAGVHPDRELRLLRLVERAVRAAARGRVAVEPGDGAGDRPHRHRAGAQDRPGGRGRRRPGCARLLQVHRLLPVVGPGRARPLRRCLQLAAARRSRCRSGSRSSPSRRSPTWSTPTAARCGRWAGWTRCVYISYFPHLVAGPIVRASEFMPQIARRLDPRRIPVGPRLHPDPGRRVQEGGAVRSALEPDRRPRVRRAQAALRTGDAAGDVRLRRPDLLRLQRLHRHRHRHRPAAGHPLPAELRRAVHRHLAARLLAALAHDPVAVPARLPVHPAGRQPQGHRGAPTST